MIRFLRKIRQRFLTDNKFTKYLLYAVGETLLVVAGILIALQVDSWNEDRQKRIQEREFLNGFKIDLESDLAAIYKTLPAATTSKKAINFILDYMKGDLPWNDSLMYQFGNISADWNTPFSFSTYESITSHDWSIISNKELRESLISYYRTSDFTTKQKDIYNRELFEASRSVWNTRFEGFWESNYEDWKESNSYDDWNTWSPEELIGLARPLDFEKLKNDSEYRYSLIRLRNISNWYREMSLINMEKQAEIILEALNKELKG